MPSAAFASATQTAEKPRSSASRATSSDRPAPSVCSPATLTARFVMLASTIVFSRRRLRRQIARSTGFAATAPTGPPIHHGKVSRSFHVNRVRPPRPAAQREAAPAGDEAVVLDAHPSLRLPFGHRHAVGQPERSDPRDAVEARARRRGSAGS